jgi:hypothetical protein
MCTEDWTYDEVLDNCVSIYTCAENEYYDPSYEMCISWEIT